MPTREDRRLAYPPSNTIHKHDGKEFSKEGDYGIITLESKGLRAGKSQGREDLLATKSVTRFRGDLDTGAAPVESSTGVR